MITTILFWVSIVTGGLLILLLLLSLIGGLELDMDVGGDIDVDAGGLGLLKGMLTFISISSWVIKIVLATGKHPGIAILIGVACGFIAFALLNYMLVLLMRNAVNVNWSMNDALFQKGKVYLKIPAENGEGIVTVSIKGAKRELKAKSFNNKEITTGSNVKVMEVDENYILVMEESE